MVYTTTAVNSKVPSTMTNVSRFLEKIELVDSESNYCRTLAYKFNKGRWQVPDN